MAANNISYIPYSRKITFDGDIEQSITDSYSAVSRLQDCIMSGNLEEFKKIYETEYINNPAIYDYFKYEDENNNNWVNTYSPCTCVNKEEEPEHVHRNMNIRQCNCSNGKRYLAYLCAFNAELGCICFDTNPINKPPIESGLHIRKCEEFKSYLLQDGPIDLTYEQFYYEKT